MVIVNKTIGLHDAKAYGIRGILINIRWAFGNDETMKEMQNLSH
jgi:hypothetical protein